jgi:hypothetical protein
MCECGCNESHFLGKLPAKGGWYAIEVYPGCPDCDTSWGLGVTYVKRGDEAAEYLLDGVPDITFDPFGLWGTRILDTQLLRAEFEEWAENGDDPDSEAMYAFDELLSRGGLRRAFFATRAAAQPAKEEG